MMTCPMGAGLDSEEIQLFLNRGMGEKWPDSPHFPHILVGNVLLSESSPQPADR